jgi:ABC-type glycerol-3-phosphate transport system permease component
MALFPAVGRKQSGVRFAWWAVVFVLCFGILMHLIPFYFMISTSLKSGVEAVSQPPTLWPHSFSLQAWKTSFSVLSDSYTGFTNANANLITYFWNSLFQVGMTIILSTPITALAAYATSKLLRGPLGRWIFLYFIGTMLVPGVITLVPSYLLVNHFPFASSYAPDWSQDLSLIDTPWVVIIPAIFNVGGYFYFKAFFDTIPDSILQAARVDGGSEFNIFRRIALPMSIPVFAIVISGQFTTMWDAYLWPSLTITSSINQPLAVAIQTIITQFVSLTTATNPNQPVSPSQQHILDLGVSWNTIMVLGILQSIPAFVFFVLSFRYLLSGIRIRGLK